MIIILFVTPKSGQILVVPGKTTASPISECIVHIFNKYFNNSRKILFTFSSQQTEVASQIIKKIDLPMLINAREFEIADIDEIDMRTSNDVSVVMDESSNITELLNESKWTADTQFLVVISTSQDKMIDIFQEFWANNIVNVLLLVANDSDVHIYTYMPFNQYDCAMHKPVMLAVYTTGQNLTKEIIQTERVTNLNGCTLNGSIIIMPPSIMFTNEETEDGKKSITGIDYLTITEISKQLNFKWNLAIPKDGKMFGSTKPNPEGACGEVFLKESHFALGRFVITTARYKHLDTSVPISCERECMSWAVPVGAKKGRQAWISLLISGFSNDVWFMVTVTSISVIATFRIFSRTLKTDQHLFNENIKTIIYTYRSSLGSSVKHPKSLPTKIVFLSWLLYSFVILSSYQALMGSKLTVPPRQSNIDTFKDLLESDLDISGYRGMFNIVTESQEDDEEIQALDKRFVNANFDLKKAVQKLAHDKNIAFLGTMTTTMYGVISDPDAKGLIHFMKQCVNEFYPVIFMQKNCPFTARVNRIITSLFEAGIICKWKRQYVYEVPEPVPSVEKLSLKRMIGSFVILVAGLGAALIAFAAEHALYWYSTRKKYSKKEIR